MLQQARSKLVSFMVCSVIAIKAHSVIAQEKPDTIDQNNLLNALLIKKIDYYRQQYPEISFLVLQVRST